MLRILRQERGSVSVFILGVFVLGLMLVGTVTDLAVLQIDRRALQADADGAALAAVQGADLAQIYSAGITTYVPVDPALARQRALTLLHARRDVLAGFSVDSVTTDGRTVLVHVSARVRPPFLRLFGRSVFIDAQARATTAVG